MSVAAEAAQGQTREAHRVEVPEDLLRELLLLPRLLIPSLSALAAQEAFVNLWEHKTVSPVTTPLCSASLGRAEGLAESQKAATEVLAAALGVAVLLGELGFSQQVLRVALVMTEAPEPVLITAAEEAVLVRLE